MAATEQGEPTTATRTARRARRVALAAAAVTAVALPAAAAGALKVTSLDGASGWVEGRNGGGRVAVDAKADPDFQDGSLRLEAVGQDDWAYAYKPHRIPLAEVTQLSYRTLREGGSQATDRLTASFQLQLDCDGRDDVGAADGTPIGFFPFLNPEQGTVEVDRWQRWDAAGGLWYSPAHLGPDGAVSSSQVAGSIGGEGDYRPLADLRKACPNGTVLGFGIAHGANSAGLVSFADDVVFNGEAVNFAAGADVKTPVARFTDVPAGHPFQKEIEWLADSGITLGVGDGSSFDTRSPVERQQMAGFLYRLSGDTAYVPPATSRFSDVRPSSSLYPAVSWMADQGITQGVGDGTAFGARLSVERQQMAAFLFRFSGDTGYRPPAQSRFTDVPTSHPMYREISWLADKGITLGVGDGTRFDTRGPVQRQHMAAFLHRYVQATGG